MDLPVPVLTAIGVAILAMIVLALSRRRASRDLMAPPSDLAARVQSRLPSSLSEPLEDLADELLPPEEPAPAPRPVGPELAFEADLPLAVADEARLLLAQDRKLDAVKLVRAATGWSLASAKEAVERL